MKDAYIVGSILMNADEAVKAFVAPRLPHGDGHQFRKEDTALGVIRSGKLVGGVVYHDYTGPTVFMSGAFVDPKWALPGTLRALFDYPFNTLKVENFLTATARNNKRARRLDEGLGFELVGMIKNYWGAGKDCALYQMPRSKCRWLKAEKTNG
jgi:RimJ/RimL family protein N-acetyltransferase